MILSRKFAFSLYEGQLAGDISDNSLIIDLSDSPDQRKVIVDSHSCGGGQIIANGSLTVPLPDGYTSASYLQATIITEGLIKVVVVSPDHATSTVLVQGSATSPGMHQICEKVTSITITENAKVAAAVRVAYACVQLPDISDEDSFRGLQDDGTQTGM